MANIMISKQVLKGFSGLPVKVQKKVSDFVDRFQENPTDPGLRFHPVKEGMVDSKVHGAELPGGYRAIIIAPEKGDTYLLVHIDNHDEAYDWARKRRFEVHSATGAFQIFNPQEVESAVQESAPAGELTAETAGLFSRFTGDDLFKAGVPQALLPAVMALQGEAGFDALSPYLPPDCRDVLSGMAAGMSLDEALEEMLWASQGGTPPKLEGPGDFSHLAEAVNFDLVLAEGDDVFQASYEGDIGEWRLFLHPYQRRLVNWKTKGPMKITGAAGTGKTVALLHRAVGLARSLTNKKDRVLITTFTTNLSITLKSLVKALGPEVADRIEVTNLHKLARTICFRSGWNGKIAEASDLDVIWEEVWNDLSVGELPMKRDEVIKEFTEIIDRNGVETEEGYLTTVRTGRPRISRKQRRAVWPAFNAALRILKKRNLLTFEGAVHQARLAVETGNEEGFAHVLVDETQDFSLEALRLVKALSPQDKEAPDPLCLVGDGHQRLYGTRFPMSRAGIEVRGRSRRLKINYRTTEEIRRFAQQILEGMEVDDLNGENTATVGDRSLVNGAVPSLEKCADEKGEAEAILAWVKALLDKGTPSHAICVTPNKGSIDSALAEAGISVVRLKAREEDPGASEPGVRMGSMKRIKGLEYDAVAMACCNEDDAMNNLEEALAPDRCERYVAATRAKRNLLVTLQQV